jgi:ABC-type Fe3+/spermidine/putrescine transport system ATPase subunit
MESHGATSAGVETLALRDLRVTIGSFRLGPIALALRQGDYLVLMGPSGCGKTTLLKAIAGILQPESGEIRLGGRRVDGSPPQHRGVGYVPQHSLLFPHLTVAGNVRFGLRYSGSSLRERERCAAEAIQRAGVDGLLDRYPDTLSGGETRRVALARALAINPAVLLLDEPLSMLDPEARRTLLETLRRIRAETGVVTVHVTHLWEEARMIGGVCAMMREGRIAAQGPVARILNEADEAAWTEPRPGGVC